MLSLAREVTVGGSWHDIPMSEMISVGGMTQPRDKLLAYARDYLNPENNYAYPAYDAYHGSGSAQVEDVDLLAIVLLNAGQRPLPTYYTLHRLLPQINERLADPRLTGTFAEASQTTVEAIADLFGILDDHRPTDYVGKTKLLKVLHRKRPELIPLYDENIRRLYSETPNPPVPRDTKRTHREFALAWLPALQRDLVAYHDLWQEIVAMADPKAPITELRALDIVAWKMGSNVASTSGKPRTS
ncbi:hypothetical protein GCM10007173_30510 [Glutamicibacter ardleyensis]|uniref:Uncharacterized protein n=2 Tax=Glutamicibacter ardleyensis TaxID=225894 RepID=A0ABQ2DTS3_9MICC|nr:hypothetical protein GCM10007173_30510 [Glutamicibacter ardleyensis]